MACAEGQESEPGDVAACLGRGERTEDRGTWMRDNAGEKWDGGRREGWQASSDAEMVRRERGARELALNDAAMPTERHTFRFRWLLGMVPSPGPHT